MNSNNSSIQNDTQDQTKINLFSNNTNSINNKSTYEAEQNELKNMRTEFSLSLRKKKINEIIFSKRLKYMTNQNNINECNNNELYVNLAELEKNVPSILFHEFDIYEDKISVIHQILNKDYTMLHGVEFNEKYILQFIIYKLTKMSYENNTFFVETSDKDLIMIFYDLIKLIKENNEKKIIFAATVIIVNFLFNSKDIVKEFKKANIWKRLAEFSELKNPEINDNLFLIFNNYYSSDKSVGKEYILSNYSRYIKQVITNGFKTFIEESKNKNIALSMYLSGISLIKKLITQENTEANKNNDFDVIIKMKFIYDYLTKVFSITTSWILNNVHWPKHDEIFKFLSYLLELFDAIAFYSKEETYQLQEFRGESFVISFCSFLRFLILNKEKEVSKEFVLFIIGDMYSFLGKIFSINSENTEIYSKNKIINITEEFIQNIKLMSTDLASKIIFFLSNYADNEIRTKEIFEETNIANIIKEYSNDKLYDNKLCYNIFWLIDNGFKLGNNDIKVIIIKTFTNFLVERIKILYDLVIRDELDGAQKKIKLIFYKFHLFYNFIRFMRYQSENNLFLFKSLLDYIKISNIEEYIMNLKTLVNKKEKEDDVELIENFLNEIKK